MIQRRIPLGLEVVGEMLRAQVEELVGPKRQRGGDLKRGGYRLGLFGRAEAAGQGAPIIPPHRIPTGTENPWSKMKRANLKPCGQETKKALAAKLLEP